MFNIDCYFLMPNEAAGLKINKFLLDSENELQRNTDN